MLSVYTRHAQFCPHRSDPAYKRCRCAKWINGVPNDQVGFVRESARTRSWEQAERKARAMDAAADPAKPQPAPRVTIEHAVREYLADERSRHLAKTTTAQSQTLFEKQLLPWARAQGWMYLDELTTPELVRFRASWKNNDLTTQRKHHRLTGFLAFCINNDWLTKNLARSMKRVKVDSKPTDYFTRDEFGRIIDATHAYGDWIGGHDFHHRADRLRALILVLRWSGLSILDAVMLERECLQEGRIFLYRAKTGVPVCVPLPAQVLEILRGLPSANPRYFFWSGNGDPHTAKKGWQRSLRRLFKLANILKPDGTRKRCHPHMFRDTFAVELLLAGVPLDQVSLLLGHSSTRVTEKHYAPFVKARQRQLEASARMAWQSDDKERTQPAARSTSTVPAVGNHVRVSRRSEG